jgi:hypothetical protein
LVFFALERAGAGAAAGVLATGAGDTNTGAGTEPVPAGWLAAAEIRAANSLESRFFFISRAYSAIARWHGITIP